MFIVVRVKFKKNAYIYDIRCIPLQPPPTLRFFNLNQFYYICSMAGLERRYESIHLQTMQTGANKLSRLLRINAAEVAKQISILQSKRALQPAKYGAQLLRNKKLLKSISENFFALEENLNEELNGLTAEQWGLANKKNDILVRSYIGQVPKQYANLNLDALEAFQKRKLQGIGLSQRIHNLTELNQQLYLDYLGSGITQGRSAAAIARDLDAINTNPYNVRVFDKDGNPTTLRKISPLLKPNAKGRGIYRSPRKNLFRVSRTETNAAYRLSDYERVQQLDFVVGIKIHLSSSHLLLDVCDFNKGLYPPKFKFSGWHSNCICFSTTVLKTKDEFKRGIKSKNEVTKIPRSAQRYQKTNNKRYWDWEKSNFTKEGIPKAKVGGPSSGIEPYKISTDPRDYRPQDKILKSAAKSVVR